MFFKVEIVQKKRKYNRKEQNYHKLWKQSLFFRGPVVWNNLDRNARNSENINIFKSILKKSSKLIKSMSFAKGTCNNRNKNTDDFIYF